MFLAFWCGCTAAPQERLEESISLHGERTTRRGLACGLTTAWDQRGVFLSISLFFFWRGGVGRGNHEP